MEEARKAAAAVGASPTLAIKVSQEAHKNANSLVEGASMKKEEVEKSVKQLFAEALDKADDESDSDDDDLVQTTGKGASTNKAQTQEAAVVPKASSEPANATQNATAVAQKK